MMIFYCFYKVFRPMWYYITLESHEFPLFWWFRNKVCNDRLRTAWNAWRALLSFRPALLSFRPTWAGTKKSDRAGRSAASTHPGWHRGHSRTCSQLWEKLPITKIAVRHRTVIEPQELDSRIDWLASTYGYSKYEWIVSSFTDGEKK